MQTVPMNTVPMQLLSTYSDNDSNSLNSALADHDSITFSPTPKKNKWSAHKKTSGCSVSKFTVSGQSILDSLSEIEIYKSNVKHMRLRKVNTKQKSWNTNVWNYNANNKRS